MAYIGVSTTRPVTTCSAALQQSVFTELAGAEFLVPALDGGVRGVRGIMFGLLLSVPLWAVIGNVAYVVYRTFA